MVCKNNVKQNIWYRTWLHTAVVVCVCIYIVVITLWSYQNKQPGPLANTIHIWKRWQLFPSQTATQPAEDTGRLCSQEGRTLHLTNQSWDRGAQRKKRGMSIKTQDYIPYEDRERKKEWDNKWERILYNPYLKLKATCVRNRQCCFLRRYDCRLLDRTYPGLWDRSQWNH